ncbi:MAG: metallophosphoesterase [Bryobacteraceae bacterium]
MSLTVYSVDLTGLKPGKQFFYRVLLNGSEVFTATAHGRRKKGQDYRFTVVGDIAANTPGQRAVAYQMYEAKSDFGVVTGDIVYSRGRIAEYGTKYFPIYNADATSKDAGVPLLRSTLMVAAPGNHDIAATNVTDNPDGLAYFYYWKQPLNGPLKTVGAASTPILRGDEPDQKAFLTAAGANYPQMASFSFEYANAHWTVLDSNKVVDWTEDILLKWLEEDLASAAKADWRFVAFHHPGFNSSKAHFNDQWMRGLAPLFEKYKVDVVFSGHVHNYQRSFPMTFLPGTWSRDIGTYSGSWKLDKHFDGKQSRRPQGVVYIVTGAGGAGLYNTEQEAQPGSSVVHGQILLDSSFVHSRRYRGKKSYIPPDF